MMFIDTLLQAARAGDACFYLLFGGQGSGWFKQLQRYYADPGIKPLIDLCLDAIGEEQPYVEHNAALPYGFDAEAWLTNDSKVPAHEYLSYAAVSVPMIFITQLACVQQLHNHGFELEELLLHTRGLSGQSQGLFTASLLGLARTGVAYEEAVRKFTKYVFYLGVRAQETYPYTEPTEHELAWSGTAVAWRHNRPSPMVAVIGAQDDELEWHIRRFNSRAAWKKCIHVSLRFATSRIVLSADRSSLIEFRCLHQAYFVKNDIKYVFIRTTCPFHSTLMEPIRPRVEADFARIGFGYSGAALKIPVYSFFDGRNLQEDEEISINLYLDVAINQLDWQLALKPVKRNHITHIIDFGPGMENCHISRHVLESMGCNKPILSARALQ